MANRDGRIPLNVLRLKELRKKLGLSQERLAEECFQQGFVVSIASIKRAESGANVLYRTASNLAEYFSVPVEDLLIDRASEPLLTNVPSSPPYFFIFAIEAKCDLTAKTLQALLFSQNTTPIIQNRTFVLTWSIQESDEYVFERIRQLALQLQVALSASIRSFINVKYKHRVTELLEHPNAITPINEILVKIPWGEIAACPCFISSNCARPIKPFLTGEPDFNNWHLVSLHQSHTDCFVGRKLELETLNSGIKRWQKQEAGQTYCITGTAGIGKTSLLNQVISSLNRSSCLTTEIQILNHGSADLLSPQNIFTRAICSFTREDTDDSIRQQTVESSIPSSFHLCLYWLMGVALNESEKQLLNLEATMQRHVQVPGPLQSINGAGLMGLPADPTPPSRFVQTYAIKQLSEQPTNFDEAFSLGQKLLNRVDIPLGIMANEFETSDNPEVFFSDITQWSVIRHNSHQSPAFYLRTYGDMTWRVANVKDYIGLNRDCQISSVLQLMPVTTSLPFEQVESRPTIKIA
ncbi:helix-turn-helix domain-containing protein [Vibrio diabolicus]|uniref:helix-turn-helix domain-containing protein n=1 Tax=Vibrio diabolicus TaxID=50719 RepID=UPI003751DE01